MTSGTIRGLITTLEHSISKYGITNHLHHETALLPSLVNQIASIPRSNFGSYQIPSHVERDDKPIVWTDIFKDPEASYSIVIFRLFKGGKMPLHDHPNISGINYLLSGAVHHQSYDIVDVLNAEQGQFVGIQYPSSDLKENDVITTLPHKNNIHTFTALENTSVLQILVPDYDHKERRCAYWKVVGGLSNDVKHKTVGDIQRNKTFDVVNLSMDDIIGLNIIPTPADKVDANVPFDGELD